MTRTRSSVSSGVIGYYYDFFGTKTSRSGTWSRQLESTLKSAGHYGWQTLPHGWIGGDFIQLHNYMNSGTTNFNIQGSGAYAKHKYIGNACADLGTSYPAVSGDGSAWGADAFNRMKPTKPVFNGLNAIYEMREVPEMLRQRFISQGLKGISNYWLALQFGWKPLVQDIRKMVSFQRDAQKKLDWLLKHANKPVRRRVVLAESTDATDPVHSDWDRPNPLSGFVTQFFSGVPYSESRTVTTDRVWASARYRYWLPPGPRDIAWTRMMMARLFGLYPSPSVIYNMIPWSWLVDWFSNAGAILANLDVGVADRLATDYFYVMRSRDVHVVKDYHGVCRANPSGALVPYDLSSQRGTSLKTRLQGDPFGFATNQQDLSAMQLSILGALGMSRVR